MHEPRPFRVRLPAHAFRGLRAATRSQTTRITMTWSPADDLFTVGDNIQLVSLTDGDDNPQAADIRAFNKEVSLTELSQLHDDTIGLGTTAWSLCFADLAG